MLLRNVTRGFVLAERASVARGLWARGMGLLGRSALPEGEALILDPCTSIHMLGMRFAIDAIFVDRAGRCLSVARDLRPWRVGPLVRGTRAVVELPAGAAGPTTPGDHLSWDAPSPNR